MNGEGLPEDPELPQLRHALDPRVMHEVLAQSIHDEAVQVETCAVDRVRYRRGVRAVVQYRAGIRDRGTGVQREGWATALLYPRWRLAQAWRRVVRSWDRSEGPPAALVPHMGAILEWFPFDHWLPSLMWLVEPDFIRELMPEGGGRGTGWIARPVRYRAGVGCVIAWAPSSQEPAMHYVKAYRDDQGRATRRTMEALRADRARSGAARRPFTFAEPLAYLEDHRALVVRAEPGRSVGDILREEPDPVPVMARIGAVLAAWHSSAPLAAGPPAAVALVANARRVAELVSTVRPILATAVTGIVKHIADGAETSERAPVHGDLKPDHVIIGADAICLVDLDAYAIGDPLADVGSMLARLRGMELREPPLGGRIASAAAAFEDAYFDHASAAWRARLGCHRAASLLQEAASTFVHQLPDWPEIVDSLVREACLLEPTLR